jgi:hypothetical protein
MTLLKEKLEAAIAEWEAPKEKKLFTITNNVTRSTFDIIRDNPGITRKETVDKLTPRGYKSSSTATLISQMIRQRLVRIEGDALYANFPEYVPLRASLRSTPKAKGKVKVKVKSAAKAKVEAPAPAPAPRTAIITTNYDVDRIIKNLTIYQAKELRDALNNLFK